MHTIFIESMNNDRIQLLKQFVEEEPGNPFNVYALAMEFVNGRPDQARIYFDQLINQYPDYLPTYYHAAALYAELDERDKAAELYDKGIALAKVQNNLKTLQELQRAQQAFDEDDDDW